MARTTRSISRRRVPTIKQYFKSTNSQAYRQRDVNREVDLDIVHGLDKEARHQMDDTQDLEDLEDSNNPDNVTDPLNPDFDLASGNMLFDGNLHPPDFYRQEIKTFDEEIYDRKEYAKGTESLINHTDSQWHTYVFSAMCITSVTNTIVSAFVPRYFAVPTRWIATERSIYEPSITFCIGI